MEFRSPDWESLERKRGARLPHWTTSQSAYHVVLRLADSIPQKVLKQWLIERKTLLQRLCLLGDELRLRESLQLDHLFSEKVDEYLHRGNGNCWLQKPQIASMMNKALLNFNFQKYRLCCWAIMPNHVHVIFIPMNEFSVAQIKHSWTSYSANEANKILHREGKFWMHEPYDHIIRTNREFRSQVNYVYFNPDKANLKKWNWRGIDDSLSPLLEN